MSSTLLKAMFLLNLISMSIAATIPTRATLPSNILPRNLDIHKVCAVTIDAQNPHKYSPADRTQGLAAIAWINDNHYPQNQCYVSPGCTRFGCVGNAGVFVCNDAQGFKTDCGVLVSAADDMATFCANYEEANVLYGQMFRTVNDEVKFNVIVSGGQNCGH